MTGWFTPSSKNEIFGWPIDITIAASPCYTPVESITSKRNFEMQMVFTTHTKLGLLFNSFESFKKTTPAPCRIRDGEPAANPLHSQSTCELLVPHRPSFVLLLRAFTRYADKTVRRREQPHFSIAIVYDKVENISYRCCSLRLVGTGSRSNSYNL